jgi:hypothetical protein
MQNVKLSQEDEAAGRFVQDEAGNRYPLDPNTVYFQDKKSKVWYPDFMATLDRQRALEQAKKRGNVPSKPVDPGLSMKHPVYTKGFLEYIRVIFGVWLPCWHHSMAFAIVPINSVPELRQQIVDRDCYLHNGEPCLILGEPVIRRYSWGSRLDDYIPNGVYELADSLKWTKRLRDLQVEKEHKAAGPGKRYLELEAQLKALEAKLEEKVNA